MHGYGLSHSYGDNLANKNKTRDTQMYAEKRFKQHVKKKYNNIQIESSFKHPPLSLSSTTVGFGARWDGSRQAVRSGPEGVDCHVLDLEFRI